MSSFDQLADPVAGDMIATIQTSKGTIKVKFFPQYAPETVKNFIELSKKSFYDGLIFHRVIDGFMIQGGDPEGTGMGGESYKGPGTTLKAEIVPELKHIKGALAMARKGYDINSASSQFYIVQNQGGVMQLNGQYTIFGQVTDGLTVVDAIAKVKVNDEDRPLSPVTIKKITVEEVK
ncbi:peptidylprolyl isomerase [Candidatus Gracilibacteria bacterium]|nr:peptidylprolyl isomerase [Candidatus Gracilibacteria bacterium]